MKRLVLLPLMVCLLLAGCQYPDDDVNMPEPQKPVSELVQEKWLYASDSSYYYFANVADSAEYDGVFFRPPTDVEQEYGEVTANTVIGSYTLIKSPGKTYIELINYFHKQDGTHSRYTITTISDSKMVWEQESGEGPFSLEFTKIEPNIDPQQPISKLIQAGWYVLPASLHNFPDIYSFFNGNRFHIFNEVGIKDQLFYYSLMQQNSKTYIKYYNIDPATAPHQPPISTFEILHVSDKRMTLKSIQDDGSIEISELIRK